MSDSQGHRRLSAKARVRSAPSRASPSGQAFVGLAALGWGASILLEMAPHEDPLVGVGLVVFGLALALRAPRWPQLSGLKAWPLACGGLVLGLALVAFQWVSDASYSIQKWAILALAVGMVGSAPFLSRVLRIPGARQRHVRVSTLVGCGLPLLAAPMAVWSGQALFKAWSGSTPLEAFIRWGLVVPVGMAMRAFGWSPHVRGQTVTYRGPEGFMTVDIGAACSGIQAMALFGAVLAVFLLAARPSGRAIAFWTAVGLGGVYLTNLLRLVGLVAVGRWWGNEALLRAHAEAGWVLFVVWAIVFAALTRRYAWDRTKAAGPSA